MNRNYLTIIFSLFIVFAMLSCSANTIHTSGKEQANSKIAFLSKRDGDIDQIFVVNPDGSDVTQMTDSTHPMKTTAIWYPDGSKFTYWAYYGHRRRPDQTVMTLEGVIEWSRRSLLFLAPYFNSYGGIRFSPDAAKVVFSIRTPENKFANNIFIDDPISRNAKQLTDVPSNDFYPEWSPDGKWIAFNAGIEGLKETNEIYIISVDGSVKKQVTHNLSFERRPVWSPDGRYLLFTSDRFGNEDIFMVDLRTFEETQLTNWPSREDFAVWSPDGKRIAFASTKTGNFEIFVMNLDGSNLRNISNHPARDIDPSWSPILR